MPALLRGIRGFRKGIGGKAGLVGYPGSSGRGAPQVLDLGQVARQLTAQQNVGQTGVQGTAPTLYTTAPAHSGSTGTAGQIAYDGTYIYICTATNTWNRAPWGAGGW